ncbi:DNA (cytosine-5-)-methyltransferase [bacterium]|jgi:DNA (cytosine-5)-methyltransferase 1|nr:DNA (cytosine-5-)-methyltransferase [bacterium]MBT6831752.1 DNA (cytosine-5-)-methyltransferase [bacterium]MBT6996575.1 DNA (cytosine-5-)-methyltransferase [bacterium]MBT7772901.1 DNA (cytosine-5-)-methyltransferase [bacterium]
MKFIDLFAGIGGIRQAFDAIGGECVFTSEWDLACQKTYSANYGCDIDEIAGDITKVDEKDIPKHDVLLAGFPCQPFSIAGVSKRNSLGSPHGFLCGMQGTLFFDVARIIAHHRPKAFLLENVKNLISHDKGNTFKVIMKTLQEDLGYHVQFKVINGKGWVPQNRQRIYIVGFREKNDFNFDDIETFDAEKGPKLNSILHSENEVIEEPFTVNSKDKTKPNDKYTLSPKLWKYLQGYAEKHRKKGNGFGFGLNDGNDTARTLSARYYKDGSEILIKQKKGNPRRLTPRECARLMGFDDNFKIVVSDTQAYKQFGNSVVVPVLKAVAKHMESWIKDKNNKKRVPKKTRKIMSKRFQSVENKTPLELTV